VEAALRRYRPVARIEEGVLDGGDVLQVGRSVYVGRTTRSDEAGMAELRRHLAPHGYRVEGVPVGGCLHLKTAVTEVAPELLLLNPAWVDPAAFGGARWLAVDPGEPHAANGLRVGDALLYPSVFPRTRAVLEREGITLDLLDLDEIAKAEGAVTCCSVLCRDLG
jgi:dimethylargininase